MTAKRFSNAISISFQQLKAFTSLDRDVNELFHLFKGSAVFG